MSETCQPCMLKMSECVQYIFSIQHYMVLQWWEYNIATDHLYNDTVASKLGTRVKFVHKKNEVCYFCKFKHEIIDHCLKLIFVKKKHNLSQDPTKCATAILKMCSSYMFNEITT